MLNNYSKVIAGVISSSNVLFSSCQPNSPAIVMDYWTGWYDVWGDLHHVLPPEGRGSSSFLSLVHAIASIVTCERNRHIFIGILM